MEKNQLGDYIKMQEEELKKYYNRNTGKFLFFQKDKSNKNIHQALWAEAHFTPEEAMNYSNELIYQTIIDYSRESKGIQILDLGCGVGESLFYLCSKLPPATKMHGVSISSKQIAIAQQRAMEKGIAHQCHFIENDFHCLSNQIPRVDIAYCIEAFVHSRQPRQFFEEISKKLKPGGRLILIDDFLSDRFEAKSPNSAEQRIIEQFKYGWVLGNLNTRSAIKKMANAYGFQSIKEMELTSYLKYRIRDRLVRLFTKFLPQQISNDYLKSLIGGDARQRCIQNQLIQYKMLVFEKQ